MVTGRSVTGYSLFRRFYRSGHPPNDVRPLTCIARLGEGSGTVAKLGRQFSQYPVTNKKVAVLTVYLRLGLILLKPRY